MKYIVPDGCVFRSVAGVEFNTGEKLPENYRLKKGDELYSQDYHYTYLGRNKGGWGVRVKDTSKTEYGEILPEIALDIAEASRQITVPIKAFIIVFLPLAALPGSPVEVKY